MTMVINLYGGPGSGKSTVAAQLFAHMKRKGIKCELVKEYAKDLAYRDKLRTTPQHLITQEQFNRESFLYKKVDYIITDSPVPLGLVYASAYGLPKDENNDRFIRYYIDSTFCNTINFFLQRHKPYETYGREQTKEEAQMMDKKIYAMLVDNHIPFTVIKGDDIAYLGISRIVDATKF